MQYMQRTYPRNGMVDQVPHIAPELQEIFSSRLSDPEIPVLSILEMGVVT